MVAFASNIAAGKWGYWTELPGASDGLAWLLLQEAGLPNKDTLQDFTSVSALLASSANEATFGGYARRINTSGITNTVDNTNNWRTVKPPNVSWTTTTAQQVGKIVLAYIPNTAVTDDTVAVPLFYDDTFNPTTGQKATTSTNGTLQYTVNANGVLRAVPT